MACLEMSEESPQTYRHIPCNVPDGTDHAKEDAVLSQKTWRS